MKHASTLLCTALFVAAGTVGAMAQAIKLGDFWGSLG